jgi:hypothetical protein
MKGEAGDGTAATRVSLEATATRDAATSLPGPSPGGGGPRCQGKVTGAILEQQGPQGTQRIPLARK